MEPDHHELLRAGIAGDAERLDHIYRTLAFRYHPDDRDNGNSEIFLRITEIYRILSVSKPRPEREIAKRDGTAWQTGLRGLKDKRAAVLGLLCQRRMSDYRSAFVSTGELEPLTGMTADEIGFTLWYLREKGAVTGSDSSPDYSISAKGVDIWRALIWEMLESTPSSTTYSPMQVVSVLSGRRGLIGSEQRCVR